MELEIFEALTAANVPADKAREVAHSIDRAIDQRYSIHEKQLATRGDLDGVRKEFAEMEARLLRAMNEMQRWTLGAIFAAMAALAIITKLWH